MEENYDVLTDLFKNLRIEENNEEDETKMEEKDETKMEEKNIIKTIITLKKKLNDLNLNKIKFPIDDFKIYIQEIKNLNTEINYNQVV